jgi:hypothetical protein
MIGHGGHFAPFEWIEAAQPRDGHSPQDRRMAIHPLQVVKRRGGTQRGWSIHRAETTTGPFRHNHDDYEPRRGSVADNYVEIAINTGPAPRLCERSETWFHADFSL